HLFPSTHPHLPAVHGRVAYIAAVWTSPIAWGRVPIIGNVRLEILSERMVKSPGPSGFDPTSVAPREQLVVRWRTIGKKLGGAGDKGPVATREEDEFTGLFIFQFDEEGRIVKHVIEHVQEGGNWEIDQRNTLTNLQPHSNCTLVRPSEVISQPSDDAWECGIETAAGNEAASIGDKTSLFWELGEGGWGEGGGVDGLVVGEDE
ncbi:hypothetical protein O988_07765, partial [Pseudogymnoascus sp. VKM F-3808]